MITGTARLTRLGLRTGGIGLLLVVVLTAGLVTLIAGSITALYGDAGERLRYAETIGTSPASLAFNGRGYGLETIGGITAFEIGFIRQLLFPLLAVHPPSLEQLFLEHYQEPATADLSEATR